jgi:hypothetical protein
MSFILCFQIYRSSKTELIPLLNSNRNLKRKSATAETKTKNEMKQSFIFQITFEMCLSIILTFTDRIFGIQ